MKKTFILILILFSIQTFAYCAEEKYTTDNLVVYELKGQYGLKDKSDKVIVHAQYKKLIRLGKSAWIIQKKNKFGLIDCQGNYLIKPKYQHVERMFNNKVKLGNEKDYGIYDEFGKVIVPPEFTSIEPLFGQKYVTCKNYQYGIYSDTGKLLLDNKYEFIYAPSPKTLRIKYQGEWYEIESISKEEAIKLPESMKISLNNQDFKITKIIIKTGVGAGYSIITVTDYTLKIFSTISTAYEDTIDELMLSQGAETVSILMKLSWVPRFPVVYTKKYCSNLFRPNRSPLSNIRDELKTQFEQ